MDSLERLVDIGAGLEVALDRRIEWITVEWSRSKPRAISASERSVCSRATYIASWRPRTRAAARRGESMSAAKRCRTSQTARWIRSSCSAAGASGRDVGAAARAIGAEGLADEIGGRASPRSEAKRGDPRQRALEPAQVRGRGARRSGAARRGRGSGMPCSVGEAAQQRDPGRRGRAPASSTVSPQAKRSRIRSAEPPIASRRAVAGEHDLAARRVELVEGVEELLLGPRLALEELDVVDQQDADARGSAP